MLGRGFTLIEVLVTLVILMFGLLGISIVLAMLMVVAVRRSLVKPLMEMAAAMKTLADGDASVEVPSTGRKD